MATRRGGGPAPKMIVEDLSPASGGGGGGRSELTPSDVAGDMDMDPNPSTSSSGGGIGGAPSPSNEGDDDDAGKAEEMQPLSIERRSYRAERHAAKVRHWKDGHLAAGLVELTWRDELTKTRYDPDDDNDGDGDEEVGDANGEHKACCSDMCSEEMEPTCCCLQLSGAVCARLGAGRVGNMAILRESTVLEEVEVEVEAGSGAGEAGNDDDGEVGLPRTEMVRRTRLDCVVGPYWPMLFCVTWPLVLGVSLWTAVSAVPGKPLPFQAAWVVLTGCLVYALFGVSCRDPGILVRRAKPPKGARSGEWRWSDQAQTYRPRGAVYDSDCGVIIEEFDHTCPWTGTGIGKKNMPAFQGFVAMVFVCLIMDILTLTGAFGCPWMGTAIGRRNMPSFSAFLCLMYLAIMLSVALLMGHYLSVTVAK